MTGAASPAGRLPVTVYRSTSDLAPFADYRVVGRIHDRHPLEP